MSKVLYAMVVLGVAALFIVALVDAETNPSYRTARVSEIVNIVRVRTWPDKDFSPAVPGIVLGAQGQIQTGSQSSARLDLDDGVIVRLSENTHLILEEVSRSDASRIYRFQMEPGKIWVTLLRGAFELNTPVGVATVRGSYATFDIVRENPDDPQSVTLVVDCLEGSCTAKNEIVAVGLGNLERVVLPKGAREANRIAAPPDALPEFLRNNSNPESQRILPTLTAAPALTKTREPLPPATPFRTMTPLPRPGDGTPIAPPATPPEPERTPVPPARGTVVPAGTLEPRPIQTLDLRASITPIFHLTDLPTLVRPTEPLILVRPTATPIIIKPTEPPIIIRPTDPPIIIRPTSPPIIIKPTDPPVRTQPTSPPIIIKPTNPPLRLQATSPPVVAPPPNTPIIIKRQATRICTLPR